MSIFTVQYANSESCTVNIKKIKLEAPRFTVKNDNSKSYTVKYKQEYQYQ